MTVTGASILMTIERPGIMTRSEVKTSVNEGRGMLEIPIMRRRKEKNRRSVRNGQDKNEKGVEGGRRRSESKKKWPEPLL